MSLVPNNQVWIEANFKETQLSGIHKGQTVEVELILLSERRQSPG